MEIDSDKIKQYALFHVNRKIINLYKYLLFILEDLRDEKYDIKDPRAYQQTRKRILDLGNDAIREIEENFKQLEINVKVNPSPLEQIKEDINSFNESLSKYRNKTI